MYWRTIVDMQALHAKLEDPRVVIVDCRFSLTDKEKGLQDYQQGHIPGAVYAHLDDDLSGEIIPGRTGRHPLPSVEEFVAKLQTWGVANDSQVIAYDDSHGGIAARLWWMLRWLGHDWVAVLNGGWKYWTEQGGRVESMVCTPPQSNFEARNTTDMSVDADYVDRIKNDDAFLLLDARAAERYRGEVEPIDPVAGHIEGAINRPFLHNLRDDGLWKKSDMLREELSDLMRNRTPEHTIFYCGSGVTACHNVLAMNHAGLGWGKLYPGSWSEWITRS